MGTGSLPDSGCVCGSPPDSVWVSPDSACVRGYFLIVWGGHILIVGVCGDHFLIMRVCGGNFLIMRVCGGHFPIMRVCGGHFLIMGVYSFYIVN